MSNRNPVQPVLRNPSATPASKRLLAAALFPAFALSGCYAVPIGHDAGGNPHYVYSPVPIVHTHGAASGPQPIAVPSGPAAVDLPVKLYPINDLANQTGILTGQVTNMMTGKGRF